MTKVSVLVVDDQPVIRAAVAGLIAHEADLDVVGEASTGEDALRKAQRLRPDVVVMDVRMPERDGIWATRQICADTDLSGTRVLILTTFEDEAYVVQALRAGASGFIGKGADPEEIVAAVRTVHVGEALLSPRATRALIDRYSRTDQSAAFSSAPPVDLGALTERETEVLVMVAQGLSNAQIAEALVISPLTAKTHVNRIMTKVSAHDRAQLVIAAYENGLVRPGVE
ncbi:response regulator transcription factor [Microbacterium lacus]|uniref:response regulator transcription factor n=1 Tax=Microbacterium lacus TaxID=415217 RepID=UPI0038515783